MNDNHERPDTIDADAGATVADQERTNEELQRERDDYYNRLLRTTAEFDNYRKRVERDRQAMAESAAADLVRDLLPLVDDLERALDSVHDGIKDDPWVDGVRLVMQKFRGVLEAAGLQEIHALSQPFNPERHEAVGQAPGPEGEVVRVLRRGYTLGDRVVRPAMVMVGDGDGAADSGGGEASAAERK